MITYCYIHMIWWYGWKRQSLSCIDVHSMQSIWLYMFTLLIQWFKLLCVSQYKVLELHENSVDSIGLNSEKKQLIFQHTNLSNYVMIFRLSVEMNMIFLYFSKESVKRDFERSNQWLPWDIKFTDLHKSLKFSELRAGVYKGMLTDTYIFLFL